MSSSLMEDWATWTSIPWASRGWTKASFHISSSVFHQDGRQPRLFDRRDRGVDVLGLERHMVNTFSARFQESLNETPLAQRCHEFDLAPCRQRELRESKTLLVVVRREQETSAECVHVERCGGRDVVHRERNMIEFRIGDHRAGSVPYARRARNLDDTLGTNEKLFFFFRLQKFAASTS